MKEASVKFRLNQRLDCRLDKGVMGGGTFAPVSHESYHIISLRYSSTRARVCVHACSDSLPVCSLYVWKAHQAGRLVCASAAVFCWACPKSTAYQLRRVGCDFWYFYLFPRMREL